MAVKTLSDQLLALLDADTQAKVKAAFASNPQLIAQDMKGAELVDVWSSFGGELETPTTTTTTTTTPHTPTLPSAASTTAAGTTTVSAGSTTTAPTATTANGNADALAAVLAELRGLKDQMSKDYVPVAKLGEYRTELLASAIKSSDDYASVRESHRAEFNEPLDRAAFEKFVADQRAANISFRSMSDAHDVFVRDKRTAAQTAKFEKEKSDAIAEAKKQWQSGASVPGQTQTTALSPAQQVIAKAKASATGGGAESAAMRVARQLEELDRNRASVQ